MGSSPESRAPIALTGATGFVGRHLVDRFRRDGWNVRALVRRPGDLDDFPEITVIEGDLGNRDALARLVDGAGTVVHCAGLIHGGSRAAFHAVNVEGTARLIDVVSAAAPGPRFILVSSLAAREPGLSDYAASKRGAEDVLCRDGRGLDWIVLRPPAVYGPGDKATLSLFRMVKRGVMPVPANAGRDSARLSLIYVEDLAAAVAAMVSGTLPTRSVFELCDPCPQGYSWRAIGDIGGRAVGTKVRQVGVPFRLMTFAAAANLVARKIVGGRPVMTPGKVRELFHPDWTVTANPLTQYVGWEPEVSVEDGFARTVRWYREHRLL